MKKSDYTKPMITKTSQSSEPVEAGCCLRSCGGSPAIMQVNKNTLHETDIVKKASQLLK